MKLRKYELWLVNEETEGVLDLEYIVGHSDEVNSSTCCFEIWPIGEEHIDFEKMTEEIMQTKEWYERWYSKATELLMRSI
tara:strand:+ start:1260 stop:1499 length:240 start_codon:yes stop_codon:yes gene_type:complete